MADEMNGERATFPEGITRDDTVHGETYYTASDYAKARKQGFRDGVASLSAPLQSALDVIERWARDAYVVCGKPSTQEGFEAAWKAEDADAYAVWVAGRASLAASAPAATAADGKWYMLSRDGMATLCADRDDAMTEAASADKLYPNGAPHRALQLVAANAGGEPVAGMNEYGVRGYLAATLKCWHRLTGDEAAELVAMTQRLSGLYTHPSPQAAPLEFTKEWCMAAAKAEEDSGADISAGVPDSPQAAQQAPAGATPSEPSHAMYAAAQKILIPTGDDDGGSIMLNTSQVRALWQSMLSAASAAPGTPASPTIEGESGKEVGHADQA